MTIYDWPKSRRGFLRRIGTGASAALVFKAPSLLAAGLASAKKVRIVQFDPSGIRSGVVEIERVE